MAETHVITVAVPRVPHGPVGITGVMADADYYREAAVRIRHHARRGHPFAGSNLTEATAQLCDAAALALEQSFKQPDVDSAEPASPSRTDTGGLFQDGESCDLHIHSNFRPCPNGLSMAEYLLERK